MNMLGMRTNNIDATSRQIPERVQVKNVYKSAMRLMIEQNILTTAFGAREACSP